MLLWQASDGWGLQQIQCSRGLLLPPLWWEESQGAGQWGVTMADFLWWLLDNIVWATRPGTDA